MNNFASLTQEDVTWLHKLQYAVSGPIPVVNAGRLAMRGCVQECDSSKALYEVTAYLAELPNRQIMLTQGGRYFLAAVRDGMHDAYKLEKVS